eukprot:scaffold17471_cov115-Isochrysis_galbana.AAC.1
MLTIAATQATAFAGAVTVRRARMDPCHHVCYRTPPPRPPSKHLSRGTDPHSLIVSRRRSRRLCPL